MAVDLEPHPDPYGFSFIFPPGSAFNMRIQFRIQEAKYNVRKLLINVTLLSFLKINLHKLHCFLLLCNL